MRKPRDNNVKWLYFVENNELPAGRRFSDHDDARDYVRFITGTPLWTKQASLPRFVKVFSLGDLKYSEARRPNEVWLCNGHLDQQCVLHELSHFPLPEADHGPAFINFYLMMIRNFMGTWYEEIYADAFRREGIKF